VGALPPPPGAHPPEPPRWRGDWGGAATAITRDAWVIPFLSLLGYDLHANPHPYEIDEAHFAISHRAGAADDAPPVHIVGVRQDLGRAPPGSLRVRGGGRIAPHVLVQEYLNRSEQVWGLVTNGRTLRLLAQQHVPPAAGVCRMRPGADPR
jgi:hypothetical protein